MSRHPHLSFILLVIAGLAITPVIAFAGSSTPSKKPMSNTPLSSPLVTEAVRSIRAAIPSQGELVILLQVESGVHAQAAGASLREQLQGEGKIRFVLIEQREEPPVPDANVPGAHVHASTFVIQPFPTLVVMISEAEGQLHIAARDPGRDPLGPPEMGWRWILPKP